jgi:FkbM family methyltransferase
MIVKNESHIIVKTLNNLCDKINFSYWVICDTGSTDNTKELIIDFFKEKNIRGELLEHEWRDFGHNRTLALESAYNKTDLLFIFDADDEIVGNLVLPNTYEHDGYTFNFGNDVVYIRPLLINNRKKWCFVGVLHEYLACSENSTPHKNIEGDYYIVSGRTGNRSKNPNKYFDDANILKKAHYDIMTTDYGLSCRYAFYCAQSYKDSGYIDESIEWYKKCLDLNMWLQEKYVSAFTIGNLYMAKNDMKNALKYWYKTIEYDPERIEGIINAINFLTKEGQHVIINAFYHKFKNYNKNLREKLFMVDSCYKDQLEYNNSISAFYANDKQSGYECCKKIFLNRLVHDILMKCTISNFLFYIDFFDQEKDHIKTRLFYLIDDIICDFGKKNEEIEPNMITCWNILFDKCKHLLCEPTSPSMSHLSKKSSKNSSKETIMITFTTCKRMDLFKQTVYSILNHWMDFNLITDWFCVDDNSDDDDRKQMQSLFPWIQYYMKTDGEKGHRNSMNIIWNKLNETKPKYWIHMEDDFLFHRKMNYIEEGIKALNSNECSKENVKQVLFNRNYGEIIDHYNSRGHVSIANHIDVTGDIVLHKHCDGVFNYMNCHYWPHYSFRPSIIDVGVILELGNYDSENQFFEMDYAKKWNEKGFKSAFFNKITCKHIGRLTSDRNTKTVKNAYDLNNEEQFANTTTDKIDSFENNNAFIKIINLERRNDRKKDTINKLSFAGISCEDYEFSKAIDGALLKPTNELKHLFRNNDFINRRGVIGCALSHYNLWKRLVNDSQHEYYVIMEDDFVLCSNFKKQLETLKSNNEFDTREVLFLGYHMFENTRDYNLYNMVSESVDVVDLNKDIYIGGYFAYSINKNGARKILEYIDKNGINHGIDYLNKILDNNILHSYECQPQIVFSDWNENGKKIDSDIQNLFDAIDFSRVEDVVPDTCRDIEHSRIIIGFHSNQLCERGTEVALYDYANHNEKILGNKSIIFFDKNSLNNCKETVEKFNSRFTCYGYNSFNEIDDIVVKENIDLMYDIKYGTIDNRKLNNCPIVNHSVFVSQPHGYKYAVLHDAVNKKYKTNVSVVPHMIDMPNCNEDLREELKISKEAIVLGRIGGFHQFDVQYALEAIIEYLSTNKDIYILLVNTKQFIEHKNVIYLDKKIDKYEKAKFINTCDAMIHARSDGETFSLSIGEFCFYNKPIITTPSTVDNIHLEILGEKAIVYNNKYELLDIFKNIRTIVKKYDDWNAYKQYTPENVMRIFHDVFLKDFFDKSRVNKNVDFVFIPGVDVIGSDLYMHNVSLEDKFLTAIGDPECIGFNSLGFFKDDITKLEQSGYFKEGDGVYIKKHVYEEYLKLQNCGNDIIRIKMLCNWTDSKQLCKEWSNMCESGLRWKNYRMVWTDRVEDIDYYVIINKPPLGAYYDAKKTIVFQMEPWVYDESKPWGVKTWGEWAEPDENKFMHVHSHKKYLNNVQWLNTIPDNLVGGVGMGQDKLKNRVMSIISEKNFDEGHIKRIEFIRYMESSMNCDFVDVYGRQNYHNFMNYKGTVENDNKYMNYKYCINVENNSEYNYATEKIWEPILCECLCFYWGCPNIRDYIDSRAFVLLDMNDFEKSHETIKRAIEEDWWSERIDIIRKEKAKILNELAFFPTLDKIIQNKHVISDYFINNNNTSVQCNPDSSFGKVFICGCVKNSSKYLNDVFKNINNIIRLFSDYKIIIAYDDSSDNSLDILHKLGKDYKMDILKCDNKSHYVCENICKARNTILQHIRSENKLGANYMIFMDIDDVCADNINIENIESMLHRNEEWDAISFNRHDYYHIWALSLDEYVISCQHWDDWVDVANIMKKYIKKKLGNLNENELLEVYSAFNGLAIYKIEKFINCNYECNFKNNLSHFTENVIKNNEKILNKVIKKELVVDCEHRHFHLDAIKKNGAKIRISPLHLIKNNFVCKKNMGYLDENYIEKNNVRNKIINYIKNDSCIGSFIKDGVYWEEWMFKYIQQNYIENTNIIDLGGNIGTTTLLMSEVLSNNCKIFTFEPIYSDILFKNILDNNLTDKVVIYPYGVGNEIKTVKIKPINFSDNINFGGISIINNLEDKYDSYKIDIVPLDYFNFENISLIKIDVEHMEIEVIEGCVNLIKRCKPTIIIETYQLNKFKESGVFKKLMNLGYEMDIIPEGCNDYIMKIKSDLK